MAVSRTITTSFHKEEITSPAEAPKVRHGVIIAAGSGSRFGKVTHMVPKPLIEVASVPIILRTILTAHKAGIDTFTVVTGYKAEVLEDFLEKQAIFGIEVRCVRNDRWLLPNGLSVLEARGHQPEPFVLLMSDHLFEESILEVLLSEPLRPGHCRLAVDFRLDRILDIEDATKVRAVDGYVQDIGKGIEDYNAIDTGIFLCSHAIFDALDAAVAEGRQSLSEGVLALARRNCMEAVNIGDMFWQDVDNERDLREGEKRLLKRLMNDTDKG